VPDLGGEGRGSEWKEIGTKGLAHVVPDLGGEEPLAARAVDSSGWMA